MTGMFVRTSTASKMKTLESGKYQIYDIKAKVTMAEFDDLDTACDYYMNFTLPEYPWSLS